MIPLFTPAQIREADEYAINNLGIPSVILMENASLSIYNGIKENCPDFEAVRKIGIVCGKGNNGGDGFALARHFAVNGYDVNVIYLGNEEEMSPDCLSNYKILAKIAALNDKVYIQKFTEINDIKLFNGCDIIADALLGSGAMGELKEPYSSIVDGLNKVRAYKAAVDIPTGLDSDRGTGTVIFNADLTITLAELKRGLYFGKGYANCGKIIKGKIGIDSSYFDRCEVNEYLIEPEDVYHFIPQRSKTAYKYSAGKVLTIAGSASYPGAAIMTAAAVLKTGAGASVLKFPKSAGRLLERRYLEVVAEMYEDEGNGYLGASNADDFAARLEWADTAALGPGLGRDEATQQAVLDIISGKAYKNLVIDADGLYALRGGRYTDADLRECILTPHHAEFASLLNIPVDELQKDLLSAGRRFTEETGCYLVLKGAPTIVFNPEGEAFINTAGNSGMAKFGTGDVLTGIIAGFTAQHNNIEEAIIAAVYLHSLTGDILAREYTEYGYTATDIIEKFPSSIQFIRKSFA